MAVGFILCKGQSECCLIGVLQQMAHLLGLHENDHAASFRMTSTEEHIHYSICGKEDKYDQSWILVCRVNSLCACDDDYYYY